MKKMNLIIVLLFALITNNYSQSIVKGRVVDKDGAPIPYTSVRLLDTDSTFVKGTATDTLGAFQFENVSQNRDLKLAFTNIGYEPALLSIHTSKDVLEVPLVMLNPGSILLKEVEIKAQSIIRSGEKVLIIPEKKITQHSKTGYDLLYNLMIPGIQVDRHEGTVKTIGGNVTLYINGRKVDYREIQNLNPNSVVKVEYFDNPTGNYLGDVASINYVIKEATSGGYLAFDAKQIIGFLGGDYNFVTKIADKQIVYTVFGGHSMERYNGIEANVKETFIFPGYTVNRNGITKDALSNNNHQYLQFMVQNQNEKRALSGKVTFVRNESPNNIQNNELEYSGYYNKKISSHSNRNQLGWMPSIELYSGFNLPNNQHLNVSLYGSLADNKYERMYSEPNFISQSTTKEKFYNINTSANYNIQLKNNNSFAAQFHHFHKISIADYSGDYDISQRLWSGETLLFLGYNQQIGQRLHYSIQPGTSLLQYALKGDTPNRQYSARLNMSLMYMLSRQQQIRLVANIGNSFPQIATLNRVDQVIDFLQIKRGNPNLKNMTLYNNGIIYSLFSEKFNLQCMAIYNYFKNAYSMNYFAEGDKMVASFGSEDKYQQIIGVLSGTWKLTNSVHLKGELAGIRTVNTGSVNVSQNSLKANLDINYYLRNFIFNIYVKSSVRELEMGPISTYNAPKYGASVQWSRNRWHIEGGVNTPFVKKYKIVNEVNHPSYKSENTLYSRNNQNFGYIKVSYSLNFGKNVDKEQRQINTNIDTGILKVE
ncbi:hypothetical protein HMPREF1981_00262 [Bacteroides pyogenes F0041]|uniref:Outer membrane protein beta-barrel domain-containing protein n=1 Tax=Bacteroides pyogenes F0041 TaxID=1321819 RepID=U2CW70_9BACE|nr:TonB-dependent receptor [Bacteroides pyogenes]ERI88795.1 hypothetical protein HMPREF1981_00262 [Bacteroides pyogenes F0041]MBB3896264.1 hypothetical protein [Bacteroides pyogenes]GAE23107.1 putative TonB-dependent receptor [Bacteroides pyogenes JCM 10003]SUV31298.1 TonB-dependent receptor [Bacteroides pyogenes]